MAREFGARGIRVHGFDHRGHGETLTLTGNERMARGHLGSLERVADDVAALLQIDRDAAVPRFLVGWRLDRCGVPTLSGTRWATAWVA